MVKVLQNRNHEEVEIVYEHIMYSRYNLSPILSV
jgi:hypothetical protein